MTPQRMRGQASAIYIFLVSLVFVYLILSAQYESFILPLAVILSLPAGIFGAFLLLLVGYGTKMGLAPLHTWLPDAHSEAPSIVSALLSGVLLNCAFLAILRAHVARHLAVDAQAFGEHDLAVDAGAMRDEALHDRTTMLHDDFERRMAKARHATQGKENRAAKLGEDLNTADRQRAQRLDKEHREHHAGRTLSPSTFCVPCSSGVGVIGVGA